MNTAGSAAWDTESKYHLPEPATSRDTPQRHNSAPMVRDSNALRGATFSIATYAAITNTQTTFMTPTTKRMPIRAKQHPTQYIPFRNPSPSARERFAYPASSTPRGDRQRVRHASLREVNWKSPATMRRPALSGVLALAIMGVTNAASRSLHCASVANAAKPNHASKYPVTKPAGLPRTRA